MPTVLRTADQDTIYQNQKSLEKLLLIAPIQQLSEEFESAETNLMRQDEQSYIEDLRKGASEARELFSNPRKSERERMVVRAFLRCIGIQFADNEILSGKEEPVDVMFQSARFQVMEILGDQKRGKELQDRQRRYEEAQRISDLIEPWDSSEPMSYGEVVQVVESELSKKASHYGVENCSKLDALVYIDLPGRHLWPLDIVAETVIINHLNRQGWRSVSMLFLPYGTVLVARPDAPEFLKDKMGRILNQWPHPDGWFDI